VSRQKLGQHFLIRGSILERIAAAACPPNTDLVVEIGPGRGALTERLLRRAARVVAVEVDHFLVEHLRQKYAAEPRLQVIEADVLKTDIAQWGSVPLAGNLPYYIASVILEQAARLRLPRAVFLIQKEVAERVVAKPGSRGYGYLTAQIGIFATSRMLFEVKPAAFHPPPKVDSAVVLLEPKPPMTADPDGFLTFAGLCFAHKRKTVRNNLAGAYGKNVVDAWPEAGLRAEQIPLEGLLAMYERVSGAAEKPHAETRP
jgi:16S rRNA (adenine1518-N6/adenine1519-N6)-dimethyltransferase